MILYFIPAEHRYVHRMADVPKGVEPKKVDVPTDLAGLMGFLNDLWAAHQIDLGLAKISTAQAEEAAAEEMTVAEAVRQMVETPVPTTSVGAAPDIVELIMDTEPKQFGPVLSATLERLGELRKEGVDSLKSFLKNNTAAERGIGALFVEAFGGRS